MIKSWHKRHAEHPALSTRQDHKGVATASRFSLEAALLLFSRLDANPDDLDVSAGLAQRGVRAFPFLTVHNAHGLWVLYGQYGDCRTLSYYILGQGNRLHGLNLL